MKAKTLFLLPFVILVACGNHNDSEELDEKEKQQMTERAQELATFLTDNYSEGDSVYFTHTNLSANESNREGFVVTLCEFRELEYEETPETFEQEVNIVFVGYKLVTALRNDRNTLYVTFFLTKPDRELQTSGSFVINAQWDNGDCQITKTDNKIKFTCADTYCTLQKNVGIVSFGDNNEKWELVR